MKHFSDGKKRWIAAYFQTGSVPEADRISEFQVYPRPEETHLEEKLNYMKEHKLNLYLYNDILRKK